MATFEKATKKKARLRLALIGPSGSGKTYSALAVATALGDRVALIDTEHRSASKYADLFAFDTCELETFAPGNYIDAIHTAEEAGYDVLCIDSLSHAWVGKGGELEMVDKAATRPGENRFTAWRHVTPHHNALVDALVGCKCHLIVTMRSKTEYVIEENEKGKKVPRKIGMAPVQRDGLEYEFDVAGDMNQHNDLVISKTRCPALAGEVIRKPGPAFAKTLRAWLTDGAEMPKPSKNRREELGDLFDQVAPDGGKGLVLSEEQAKVSEAMRQVALAKGDLTKAEIQRLAGKLKEAEARIHKRFGDVARGATA